MHPDLWTYPAEFDGKDLIGFEAVTLDGEIGEIKSASYETGLGYIVIETRSTIPGQKTVLPAAAIEAVDEYDRKVYVNSTTEDIERAPEFDPGAWADDSTRAALDRYYGGVFGFYTVP